MIIRRIALSSNAKGGYAGTELFFNLLVLESAEYVIELLLVKEKDGCCSSVSQVRNLYTVTLVGVQ